MLSADDAAYGTMFRLIAHDKRASVLIDALIAKARGGGLPCWQRGIATGDTPVTFGGRLPMQKHERKAKRMIEKAGFRVPSDAMLTAGSI